MQSPHLEHFDQSEFVTVYLDEHGRQHSMDWWPLMSPRLLVMLDIFRHRWGAPVMISPNRIALGRYLGEDNASEHNVDRWAAVLAADVFPAGMDTAEDMRLAVKTARSIGFTGIGVYPHWQPSPGLHLGVRPNLRMGEPAYWGGIDNAEGKQIYVSIEEACRHAPIPS